MRQLVNNALDTLQRAVTSPREELNRWQAAARYLYDFGRYGWRQLSEDDAPSLAAALSFRMLFGLLPVLVVVTVTARAFLGDQLPRVVAWVVEMLGADDLTVSAGEAGESIPLGDWLESLVAQASQLNLAALGWIGAAVLVYSAISLMVTIENSFNRIVRAPSGRPWLKRIPLYWFVLTVGPLLLGLTPYLESRYAGFVEGIVSWQWLLQVARVLWSLLLVWAFMLALYLWVPNVSLGIRAAAIGALLTAVLLETGKRFLGAYLQNAFGASALYGSLGLVPLFMLWVYLMWMAVLFGLELAAMVHYLHGRRVEELEKQRRSRGELVDPASVLLVMQVVATRFARGESVGAEAIAEQASLPQVPVERMIELLVTRGFLHRVGGADNGVALARPADSIGADELMRVGWELADAATGTSHGAGLVSRLREAQLALAGQTTLAGLAASPSA